MAVIQTVPSGERLEVCRRQGDLSTFLGHFYRLPQSNHHDIKRDIIYDSFGVRAANVDGVLHLTGGWSNSGDSDMVPIMMMMMIIKIIVLIEIMNIIVLMMTMKIMGHSCKIGNASFLG